MTDLVNNPPHYCQGKIECLDAIESMNGINGFMEYLRGNIVKYLWRAKSKGNPLQDLKKAQFYLNRMVSSLEQATREAFSAPVEPEPVRELRVAKRKPRPKVTKPVAKKTRKK